MFAKAAAVVGGLDPTTVLQNIYSVANLIYNQVQLVKANKQQCRRLADRVKIIEETVHGLDRIRDKNQYQAALNDLLRGLEGALEFITQFSSSSRWQRWILKAGNYKEAFEELTDTLQKAALQLNLGLAAQQIVNREADKADQQADLQFIQNNQAEIMDLNRQELVALQGIHLKQQEQQAVLALQMAAIQSQLKNLVQVKAKTLLDGIEDKLRIPYYDLVFESLIAEGSFGKIYLGKWEGRTVAIKTLEGTLNPKQEAEFAREVGIMSRLKHPNITTFYGACLEDGHACIVMEYMEQQSLDKVLQGKPLAAEQQKSLALNIAQGLAYLHRHNPQVLHRDLKSGNILVNAEGIAKLTDFGLSKIDTDSIRTSAERTKSLAWQAPECFSMKGEYTSASDVYSFGVVLWEIVTAKKPVIEQRRLAEYGKMGVRESIPNSVPKALTDLMQQCWALEPTKRCSMTQAIQQLEVYQVTPPSPTGERYYEMAQAAQEKKELVIAFQHYQKSAGKGYMRANVVLGGLYLTGQDVPQDKPKALACFLTAANQGHVRSMLNAANMLEYGDGVSEDKPAALYWYRTVCEKEPDRKDIKEVLAKCKKLEALLKI